MERKETLTLYANRYLRAIAPSVLNFLNGNLVDSFTLYHCTVQCNGIAFTTGIQLDM